MSNNFKITNGKGVPQQNRMTSAEGWKNNVLMSIEIKNKRKRAGTKNEPICEEDDQELQELNKLTAEELSCDRSKGTPTFNPKKFKPMVPGQTAVNFKSSITTEAVKNSMTSYGGFE